MVDNSVVIAESGHCNDGVTVRNTINLQEGFNPRNLLPADVASCTDVSSGVGAFDIWISGDVLTSTSETFYKGSKCLKITTNNSYGAQADISGVLKANTPYTFSMYVKAPAGTGIVMWLGSQSYVGLVSSNISTNGSWQRFSITGTPSTDINGFKLIFRTLTTTTITFYVDCLQLELGNVASAWMPGNLLTYNQQTVETDLTGIGHYSDPDGTRTLSRDTTTYYKGTASAKLTLTGDELDEVIQFNKANLPNIISGKTYFWGAWVKSDSLVSGARVSAVITWRTSSGTYISNPTTNYKTITGNWQFVYCISVAPSNATKLDVDVRLTGNPINGNSLWYDEAWLIEYPVDDIQIQNQLAITEQPAESESLVVKPKVTISGNGSGLDSVSVLLRKIPIPENGHVNEQLVVKVNDFVQDVMNSNDTVKINVLTGLIDNCVGYEDLALKIAMVLADSGKGTDTVWRVCEFMKCLLKMKYPKAILKMKYPKAILKMKYPKAILKMKYPKAILKMKYPKAILKMKYPR